MKILMVNKFLYPNGGSETYIFQLGKQLKDLGHEIQYFGMEDEKNIVGNAMNSYTNNMNFRENSFSKLLYPFRIIYSGEARKKIRIILQDFKPDVVHLNNFNFQLTPSIIYEIKKFGIPIIYTAHDYQLVCPNHMCLTVLDGKPCERCMKKGYWQCTKRHCIHGSVIKSFLGTLEALIYKKLKTYRYIDLIICPSEFMKEMLDTREELIGKTLAMHNFTVSNDDSGRNIMQSSAEKYILYFGRYEKEKGVATLVEACRRLPDVSFRFAGKGSLSERIKTLTNIKNLGFLKQEELRKMIQNAAFTICPSEWYENCPFSVMEAIENGTPVIGANIGGISELICDGENGLLFESGNIEDLVKKVMSLWNDEELLKILKNNCQKPFFQSCTEYSKKMVNLYNELVLEYKSCI